MLKVVRYELMLLMEFFTGRSYVSPWYLRRRNVRTDYWKTVYKSTSFQEYMRWGCQICAKSIRRWIKCKSRVWRWQKFARLGCQGETEKNSDSSAEIQMQSKPYKRYTVSTKCERNWSWKKLYVCMHCQRRCRNDKGVGEGRIWC